MRSKILIITALLLASFVPAWAQQALVVEAKMDSSVLWMGEQTVIHTECMITDLQCCRVAVNTAHAEVRSFYVCDENVLCDVTISKLQSLFVACRCITLV